MRSARTLLDTGWRPWGGWSCVLTFMYAGFGYHVLNWILAMYSVYRGQALPLLKEPSDVVLFEFVGIFVALAGIRMNEKIKGVNAENPSAPPEAKA
jgi:hypothetical protein